MLLDLEDAPSIEPIQFPTTTYFVVTYKHMSASEANRFCGNRFDGASLAVIGGSAEQSALDRKLVALRDRNVLTGPVNEMWVGGNTDIGEHNLVPLSAVGSGKGSCSFPLSLIPL